MLKWIYIYKYIQDSQHDSIITSRLRRRTSLKFFEKVESRRIVGRDTPETEVSQKEFLLKICSSL